MEESIKFKDYIAHQLIGKSLHFKCNCIFPLDTIGKIINYELIGNEIVFLVDVGDKQIKIGENHPNLYIKK